VVSNEGTGGVESHAVVKNQEVIQMWIACNWIVTVSISEQ